MILHETLILDSALIKPKLPQSKLYDISDLHFKLSQKIHDLSKKHDLNKLYSVLIDIDVSDLDECYRLKIDALDAFK